MKLLAVGDSFTYGEELADRMLAWPYLLGKRLNSEVTNLGEPSAGNTKVLRNTVERANEHDIVIVAWSHFARIEMADEHGIYDVWPGSLGNTFVDSLSCRKKLLEYINHHHSDQYLYNQYLLNIILLQNYLKHTNKKYLMLDAFGNTKVRNLNTELVEQIDTTYYIGWPHQSMMEWTYKSPQGPRGHFLEQGHELVADKIYEHIRHLSWVS